MQSQNVWMTEIDEGGNLLMRHSFQLAFKSLYRNRSLPFSAAGYAKPSFVGCVLVWEEGHIIFANIAKEEANHEEHARSGSRGKWSQNERRRYSGRDSDGCDFTCKQHGEDCNEKTYQKNGSVIAPITMWTLKICSEHKLGVKRSKW